jgi:hypothetical protein
MNKQPSAEPRVTRIEIHYNDGSKDVIRTAPKERTRIPLFGWTRSTPDSTFNGAYTSYAIAAMLFQTALSRRLVKPGHDKNTSALLREFAHIWPDSDYPPAPVPAS